MGFGMESQVPQPSPSRERYHVNQVATLKKIQNAIFWDSFAQILAKMNFVQNYAMSVLKWKKSTSWKNQKKLCS